MKTGLNRIGGWRRLVKVVVVFAALGSWWFTLAPRSIGGPATYVVVSGTSMQPKYHTGDLVIVHRQPSYRLGEIVAVDVDGGHVIHRLYSGSASAGWHTKGINKTSPDVWTIPNKDILGSAWVLWRGGGRYLSWLGTPTGRAGLAAILAVLVAAFPSRRRRASRTRPQPEAAPGVPSSEVGGFDPTSAAATWRSRVPGRADPLLVNFVIVGLTLGLAAAGLTVMDVRLAGLNGLTTLPLSHIVVHPRSLGLIAVTFLALTVPTGIWLAGRRHRAWGGDLADVVAARSQGRRVPVSVLPELPTIDVTGELFLRELKRTDAPVLHQLTEGGHRFAIVAEGTCHQLTVPGAAMQVDELETTDITPITPSVEIGVPA